MVSDWTFWSAFLEIITLLPVTEYWLIWLMMIGASLFLFLFSFLFILLFLLSVNIHKVAVNPAWHFLLKEQKYIYECIKMKCWRNLVELSVGFTCKKCGSNNCKVFKIKHLKLRCKSCKKNKYLHYQKSLQITWKNTVKKQRYHRATAAAIAYCCFAGNASLTRHWDLGC